MDKEATLARKEADRWPVLLSDSGPRTFGTRTIHRDPRSKDSIPAKGYSESTPISATQAGKSDAKVKGRGRGRPAQHRQDNPSRKPTRKVKGGDIITGRSAQELGIEWPEDRCEESPSSAHHFVTRSIVDSGFIFTCIYCHIVKWLPSGLEDAQHLGVMMHIYGLNGGYHRMLDLHPTAKRMLCRIQDIHYLQMAVADELFLIALSAIMLDRSYPYDVEVAEEEML
jgi:hypothetical protein